MAGRLYDMSGRLYIVKDAVGEGEGGRMAGRLYITKDAVGRMRRRMSDIDLPCNQIAKAAVERFNTGVKGDARSVRQGSRLGNLKTGITKELSYQVEWGINPRISVVQYLIQVKH